MEKNELPTALNQDNLLGVLEKYNIDLANNIFSKNINNGIQVIVESIVGLLSYAIAFLLIFILTIIAFKILSIVLSTVFKLPGLKTINKTLSFVLGGGMCFIYINLFVALMQILTPVLTSVYPEYFNLSVVEETLIFEFFYNFEWIKFLVN